MTRTKRLLVVGAGLAVIVAAVLLAHPYPRQAVFGPRIRDVPLCAWQDAFRREEFLPLGRQSYLGEKGFFAKCRHWLGRGDAGLKRADFESLTASERETLFLSLADDEEGPVRCGVAHQLGKFDSPAALEALLRLLVDKDKDVRETASLALACSEPLALAAWPTLHELAQHRDPDLRALAASTMNDAGVRLPESLACLIRLLDDPAAGVRRQAASCLGSYRWSRKRSAKVAAAKLREHLSDEDAGCRLEAAYALWIVTHSTEGLLPVLVKDMKSREDDVRLKAVQYVATLDKLGLEAWDALVACATGDQNPRVRQAAMRALIVGGRKAVPVLLRCLEREADSADSADGADTVVHVLGAIGPDAAEAVPALLARVVASSSVSAIRALGEIKSREAVPELMTCLVAQSTETRTLVADALGDIGPPARDAVALLLPMLHDPASVVRCAAARALGKIAGDMDEVMAALVRLTDDPDNDVLIAEAATGLGPKAQKLVPALRRFLGNKEHLSHRNALPALGAIGAGAREAVSDLLSLLKKTEDQVYYDYHVVEALGKIGHDAPRVVPALLTQMNEKDEQLRLCIFQALACFGPAAKAAVPALKTFLDHDDEELAEAAAAALTKIEPEGQAALPVQKLP